MSDSEVKVLSEEESREAFAQAIGVSVEMLDEELTIEDLAPESFGLEDEV